MEDVDAEQVEGQGGGRPRETCALPRRGWSLRKFVSERVSTRYAMYGADGALHLRIREPWSLEAPESTGTVWRGKGRRDGGHVPYERVRRESDTLVLARKGADSCTSRTAIQETFSSLDDDAWLICPSRD